MTKVSSNCPQDVTGIITTTEYCLSLNGLCQSINTECIFPLGSCEDPSDSSSTTGSGDIIDKTACVCCRNENGQQPPPSPSSPATGLSPVKIDKDTGECTFTDKTIESNEQNYCRDQLGGECYISISHKCGKILGTCTSDRKYHDGCQCCGPVNSSTPTPSPSPTPTPSPTPIPTPTPSPPSEDIISPNIIFKDKIRDLRYYETCLVTTDIEKGRVVITDNSLGDFILKVKELTEEEQSLLPSTYPKYQLETTIDLEFGDKLHDVNNQYFDCSTTSFDDDHVWLYSFSLLIIPSSEEYLKKTDLRLTHNIEYKEENGGEGLDTEEFPLLRFDQMLGYHSMEEYPKFPLKLDFLSLIPDEYNIKTITDVCNAYEFKGIFIGLMEYEEKSVTTINVKNRTKINVVVGSDDNKILHDCSNLIFGQYTERGTINQNLVCSSDRMHMREFKFSFNGCGKDHENNNQSSTTPPDGKNPLDNDGYNITQNGGLTEFNPTTGDKRLTHLGKAIISIIVIIVIFIIGVLVLAFCGYLTVHPKGIELKRNLKFRVQGTVEDIKLKIPLTFVKTPNPHPHSPIPPYYQNRSNYGEVIPNDDLSFSTVSLNDPIDPYNGQLYVNDNGNNEFTSYDDDQ